MQHCQIRSDRHKIRETSPVRSLRAPDLPNLSPGKVEASSSFHQSRSKGKSLQEASLGRYFQGNSGSLPFHRSAPDLALEQLDRRSLDAKALPEHFALEGETTKLRKVPSPNPLQLDRDKLELDEFEQDSWTHRGQLTKALAAMQQAVHSLIAKLDGQQGPTNNNENNTNDNNNNHNKHNHNNTNNTNNTNNNNNKNSRESGLNSFDLDNENPESEPDLDRRSLFSFNPLGGVESSLGNIDQQEAEQSFSNIGETMTIGFSFRSFTQEGEMLGTTWDPSLETHDPSSSQLRDKKPQKKVSFKENNLAYHELWQNKRKQEHTTLCSEKVQLRQLAHNKWQSKSHSYKSSLEEELPEQDNKMTTNKTCWTKLQQEEAKQQQTATTSSEKNLAHRRCITNNLGSFSEEDSIGSLEQNASTTNWPARSQEHNKNNNNNKSLGIGTKNTAAFGILIDTGAAISLAPKDFAPQSELRPLESTLQLRTITGKAIETFGRRTVQLVGPELTLCVSFVIAEVEQALIGMDILIANQLSLITNSLHEYYLVNSLGAKTRLQPRGLQLYMPAFPQELGLSTLRGSSFQNHSESVLDDKDRTQATPGGACVTSFESENLRPQQHKNTAALGTTALPAKGARRRRRNKKKTPLAEEASPEQLPERSLEQEGQNTAASLLRNSQRTSLMEKIELAAEEQPSLEPMEVQELSLRILLTLSLRKRWLITTARATTRSQEALGEQLRSLGLEQNKVDNNIFSGDELVLLLHENSILIAGTEEQQECFFCELSALECLDDLQKLQEETPIHFAHRILEYKAWSNKINIALPQTFYHDLLQRHELQDEDGTTTLEEEKLRQNASEQNQALDAESQELYKKSVGDLAWAASTVRPDLSFEVHMLTQSLNQPTQHDNQQLRKVLGYVRETLHYSLSLQPTNERAEEKAQSLELVAFSASAWTSESSSISTTCLALWGVSLTASCKTTCANTQEEAELNAVRLALNIASHTKSFLQHLGLDQLSQLVGINLRTTSWHDVLEKGRPLALQLGLSRRNKHIQLGQLRISKVLPQKNLAHSLTNRAPRQMLLAKLRIDKEAANTEALLSVFGQGLASLDSSASFLVGMVALEQPPMAQLHPCQLVFLKSADSFAKSCPKRLPKSLQSLTLQSLSFEEGQSDSLTLHSWSFATYSLYLDSLSLPEDRLHSLNWNSLSLQNSKSQSLILHSLHDERDRFCSLTLRSLSLLDEDCFPRMSFEESSFENGSLEELDETLAHSKLQWEAGTNSFPANRLTKATLAQEAGTNSFFQSFSYRIWSFRMCLRMLLFCSFQFISAALILGTCFGTSRFPKESLQEEQLVASYFIDSFQIQSVQAEEIQATLGSFNQLDLEHSLSFTEFASPNFSHQQQTESFHRISFELRALHCAALQDIASNSLQLQPRSVESFQLSKQQLRRCFVSGGASNQRASTSPLQLTALTLTSLSLAQDAWLKPSDKRACRRTTSSTALTLTSLSLAQDAWLKTSSPRAWRRSPLKRSLGSATCPTRSFRTTSFHRSASMRSLQTTSFRRSASASALTTTSFIATSSFCVSFLFNNFFCNNSFARKEIEKKDELPQNLLEQELEKVLANQTCSLGPYDHLEQKLWQIQLQELSLQQNNQEQENQLSASVPDRELVQLYLSQLCPQDPESAISRQLPEEPLSASGLRTAAWPAAVQLDKPSFSKQKLSDQDLSNISLDKFFSENFGQQLSEQQLQNNLSTDQRQLQKNTFQQLSFEHPSFTEKILHNELATTFAKNSLIDKFVFQNFFFATLALQKVASDQLGENNLYKKQLAKNNLTQTAEEACKEQLLRTGFSRASLAQQLFSTSLVQQSGAKAASQPELPHKELQEEELANKTFDKKSFAATSLHTRTSARQLQKDQLEEETFPENSFEALSLSSFKAPCLSSLPGTACKEALLQDQLLHQQLSSRTFQQDSFSASSLPQESFRTTTSQTAAFRTGLSDRQLHRQQLDRSNHQHSSFEKNIFQKNSFTEHRFEATSLERNTLQNTSFYKNSLQAKSLDKNSFANNSFKKHSFYHYTLEKPSFTDKSLAEKSFDKNSFADSSLEQNSFANDNFQEANFKDDSFQEDSLDTASLEKTSLEKNNFEKNSLEKNSLENSSLENSSVEKSSLDKSGFQQSSSALSSFNPSSFDKKSSLEESSLAESSLATSTSALSSFLYRSLTTHFENKSLACGSFTETSFEESSFAQSNLQESSSQSSFEQSGLEAHSFEATSLERSFPSSSFSEDNLKTTRLRKSSLTKPSLTSNSFRQNSFRQTNFKPASFRNRSFQQQSFQQNSFQQKSFHQTSFQQDSFKQDSFQQPSLQQSSLQEATLKRPTEPSELQRQPFTSELSSLRAQPSFQNELSPLRRPKLDLGPPRGSAKESFGLCHHVWLKPAGDTKVLLALKLSKNRVLVKWGGGNYSPIFRQYFLFCPISGRRPENRFQAGGHRRKSTFGQLHSITAMLECHGLFLLQAMPWQGAPARADCSIGSLHRIGTMAGFSPPSSFCQRDDSKTFTAVLFPEPL